MLPKLLTEFIGTFFLVLIIGMSVLVWSENALVGSTLAPIAIGIGLVALVYMGGPISGAHYNPAVSLAMWMRGQMPAAEMLVYMGTQVVAAIAGALVVVLVTDQVLTVTPAAGTSVLEFFLLEFLFTFLLVLVILNVAITPATAGNSYYGLAIGGTVLAGAFAAGPVSGGAFNPAVALGPILVDLVVGGGETIGGLWIYLVSTFLGGAAAALVYGLQYPGADAEAADEHRP